MKTKDITIMGMCVAVLAVCSFITIPSTVPFTLQTFGVFLILMLLGGKKGTITILTYLLLGAIGVPVFAGFSGGISALLGTTGGYLLGFLLTGLTYWLFEHFLPEKLYFKVISLVLGLLLCYTFGTIWFIKVYAANVGEIGVVTALSWCVLPFLIPDGIKLALAVVLQRRLTPLLNK